MKISDLLDLIEDDSVPIREKDIIASERIMEAAMNKIRTEKEKTPVRKGMRRGTALVVIAAALLALSVTALATGLLDRVVGWTAHRWRSRPPHRCPRKCLHRLSWKRRNASR